MSAYGRAVHGAWCSSRTYPTKCRHCGQSVFYFSCECGCKVFFDTLGPPWPVHNCIELALSDLSIKRALSELGTERVQDHMAELMMTPSIWQPGHSLEPAWLHKVTQRIATPRAFQPRLIRERPVPGAERDETGIVRELAAVDPAKALGLDAYSLVGQAMLRSLRLEDCMQLTVHCGDLSCENGSSYTFLAAGALVHQAEAQRGNLIWFEVEAFGLSGKPHVWLCRSLERL